VFAPIAEGLFWVLQRLYGIVGDYGIAIIALTIGIRLAMLPLTLKQTKSMYELQRIQPKIQELQSKYKNDKQKQQEETLKFYQENKVNPFGGCLPLIVQMPIFIALFQMLGTTGKNRAPGLFLAHIASLEPAAQSAAKAFKVGFTILPDITKSAQFWFSEHGFLAALPYIILVGLFGLSIVIPQLMQPSAQSQQRSMGIAMGAMMLFFGWGVSAGVVLYWVTSSFLGVLQQIVQTRVYKAQEEHK
jgi:YidC/Oxa1 family membrane protein insertase